MSELLMRKDGVGPPESQEADGALGILGPLWLLADWVQQAAVPAG